MRQIIHGHALNWQRLTRWIDPACSLDTDEAAETHLVLIPSYNTGAKLFETVVEARQYWRPVWVVIDGSTDGTTEMLAEMNQKDDGLRIIVRPRNGGKGAAVLEGLHAAAAQGFTHVLTMDADGQHPAGLIKLFMSLSRAHPEAMILGQPIFDRSAPRLRVAGRKISNKWVHFETLWSGVGDSLFGFRVYPVPPLKDVMESNRWMRRFDFDVEAVVRLSWRGVPPINCPAPVRYFTAAEGGVSHFRYLRDNILLASTHMRLTGGLIRRLPGLGTQLLKSCRR